MSRRRGPLTHNMAAGVITLKKRAFAAAAALPVTPYKDWRASYRQDLIRQGVITPQRCLVLDQYGRDEAIREILYTAPPWVIDKMTDKFWVHAERILREDKKAEERAVA